MNNAKSAKPRRLIADLRAGDFVDDQPFLIATKDLRTTANGQLYIHCVLTDRTGQMLGRVWQANQNMFEQIPEGGFIRFKGRVENYKGNLQFIVDAIMPVDPSALDLADFMPRTEEDVDAMFARVKEILRTVQNRDLLLLLKAFLTDEPLMSAFRQAPAAIQMHHAYLGGLLEHTRNVLELALLVMPRYPQVSQDLVLAGIFLHDLGKTVELRYDTALAYTNEGQLVGHIVQAAVWIDQKASQVARETGQPFPDELRIALTHLVLAHHGQYDFGSPKLPAMPEAIAIHHLDNLDAKLHMFLKRIDADPDEGSDWTQYIPSLGTKLFKKDVLGVRPKKK